MAVILFVGRMFNYQLDNYQLSRGELGWMSWMINYKLDNYQLSRDELGWMSWMSWMINYKLDNYQLSRDLPLLAAPACGKQGQVRQAGEPGC